MIGKLLAHYRITARMGAGGMGEVWRASDTKLGRHVALKILPPEMAASQERRDRFRREAQALAALDHPGIVTVYSVEEADGIHFLTMQLVEGDSLDHLIPEGGLPVEELIAIAIELSEALATAHEKGIIHRDLKPANVMRTKENRVKVLDFGLAKLSGVRSSLGSELSTLAETQEGAVMGTVPYMSPEQVAGRAVDQRTDIFSLGVLLYEMATGHRPFGGDSNAELASAILRDTPPPVTGLRPALPQELARVIGSCLEKDPVRRPSSEAVGDALRGLRGTPAGAVRSPPSPEVDTAAARRQDGFWIAVLPFKRLSRDPGVEALAEGLTEDLVTGLSRFSYLRVIALSSTARYADATIDVRQVGRELGARYLVGGSIRQGGKTLRIVAQLVDADSGAHLWAETYNRSYSPEEIFELQDELVPRIVSTVADMNGVLPHTMSEVLRGMDVNRLSPYQAVLRGIGYSERIAVEEHAEVRGCLERAVREAPHYADGWALLSMLYAEEHKHGFNVKPDPLGRALEAARRAVAAAPSNHIAYHVLAQALFFLRDFPAFRNAADRAVDLNPMDGCTIAFMGILKAYAGEWEEGCALAESAMRLNPHHPGWYRFGLFFNAYRKKDYRAAREVALRINMPSYFYAHVALAAATGQLGEGEASRTALAELLGQKPNFAAEARDELAKWLGPGELLEHVLDGLRRAGLEVPMEGAASPALSVPPSINGRRERVAIAVLPFADHSPGRVQEWFAAGTHEALLSALQQIQDLKVTSRTSCLRYRRTTRLLPAIAEELGVRWLVEGSVVRAGDRIRLTAQLVDGRADQPAWSRQYERDVHDILALQNELARLIASHVQATLTPEEDRRLAETPRVDPEAYRAYVLGLHHFDRVTPGDFRKSASLFEEALRIDPAFAPGYAALVLLYGIAAEYGWMPREEAATLAEEAAATARRLAPDSPSAEHAAASLEFHIRRDFAAAEKSYRRAAERTSDAFVHFSFGWLLSQMGRHAEAVAALERAVDLDPRSPLMHGDLGWWLYGARRFDRAMEEAHTAIEIDPSFAEAYWLLAAAQMARGEPEQALAAFKRHETLYGEPRPWFRGYLNALAGDPEAAQHDLAELERRVQAGQSPGIDRAQIYLGLGDRDRVLSILEEASEGGVSFQPYLWPGYEPYFAVPRFLAVLRKLGLPLPNEIRR